MEHLVEMKNMTMKFPGVVALNNVSFDLRPGEVHILLGENGAGKDVYKRQGSDKGNIQRKLLQGLNGLFPGIRHFGFIIFSAQCVKSVLCFGDTVHDGMRVGDDQSVLHSTQIGSQQCDSASGIHSDNAVFSGNKFQCFFGNLVFGEKIFLLTAD